MSKIKWNDDLNTGIEDLDRQHRKILEFANRLDDVKTEPSKIRPILIEMRTYILFHFRFEESLLENANYPFIRAHKKVHELIIKRLIELQNRLKAGENISSDLDSFLSNWFYHHFQNDDAAYLPAVKSYLAASQTSPTGWFKKFLHKYISSNNK